jgi:hypothetical protein
VPYDVYRAGTKEEEEGDTSSTNEEEHSEGDEDVQEEGEDGDSLDSSRELRQLAYHNPAHEWVSISLSIHLDNPECGDYGRSCERCHMRVLYDTGCFSPFALSPVKTTTRIITVSFIFHQ